MQNINPPSLPSPYLLASSHIHVRFYLSDQELLSPDKMICPLQSATRHIYTYIYILYKFQNGIIFCVCVWCREREREKLFYLKATNCTRQYSCRPQVVRSPLLFKIIYTNIVDLWLHRHSVILNSAQYWCI